MTHPVFQAFLAQQPSQVGGPPAGASPLAKTGLYNPCVNLPNGAPIYGTDGKVHFVCRKHWPVPTTNKVMPAMAMSPTLGSFGVKLHPTMGAIIGLNNLRRR